MFRTTSPPTPRRWNGDWSLMRLSAERAVSNDPVSVERRLVSQRVVASTDAGSVESL